MKKILGSIGVLGLLGVCVFFALQQEENGVADPQEEWLNANVQQIGSLTSDDYSDLAFLKPLLEDKKIVYLGENSHGVAEYNTAKVRLVKYLHEELDFDVLAFESPLGAASAVYTDMDGMSSRAILNAIPGVWKTVEVDPLFQYIRKERRQEDPLLFTGFDMQITSPLFAEMLGKWVQPIDPSYAKQLEQLESDYQLDYVRVKNGQATIRDTGEYNAAYKTASQFFQHFQKELKGIYPDHPELFESALKVFDIRREVMQMMTEKEPAHWRTAESFYTSSNIRDESMASTLEWLATDLFQDKKIIVWAHNAHIQDQRSDIQVKGRDDSFVSSPFSSMGENMPEDLKEDSYIMGFYMHHGQALYNNDTVYEVNNGSSDYNKNGLEYILHQSGYAYSFLDIESAKPEAGNKWLFEPISALNWGLMEEKMVISNHYDGIFFVDEATPAKRMK